MTFRGRHFRGKQLRGGFTLFELVVSVVTLALVMVGLVLAYIQIADTAEWSAYSLAAQSLACQSVEQVRAAKWDPLAWPAGVGPGLSDELGLTNFTQTNVLDMPVSGTNWAWATNYVKVTAVSTNPQLRQIRADCVWRFVRRAKIYTNTVITLRASDQ